MTKLLIVGAGYTGLAVARAAVAREMAVAVTSRGAPVLPDGVLLVPFADAAAVVLAATHLVVTAPPGEVGDPVLAAYGAAVRAASCATVYLSTTGVYGDRDGAWVDEDTPPAPVAARSVRRRAAELAWEAAVAGRPLDVLRLAGIYGPGRSALDDVRAGRARCVVKPGHAFGRIHRDDVAAAVLAAMARPPVGVRVLHGVDDEPAESADVTRAAARLLGVPAPPEIEFSVAWAGMSDMARSFWAENRKVSANKTKAALGIRWRYPSYREGLAAILAEERGERPD
ncbi:MAG TPA: SDR family NAD(P)-dependent oxidoreductase [Acetobacteraceae bacterium]|nr:SDR family NAD(P)-dependent oxidoreductase [Acetobacteraceae bacterium]